MTLDDVASIPVPLPLVSSFLFVLKFPPPLLPRWGAMLIKYYSVAQGNQLLYLARAKTGGHVRPPTPLIGRLNSILVRLLVLTWTWPDCFVRGRPGAGLCSDRKSEERCIEWPQPATRLDSSTMTQHAGLRDPHAQFVRICSWLGEGSRRWQFRPLKRRVLDETNGSLHCTGRMATTIREKRSSGILDQIPD